jgi:adenosylhomocysteine nucleosidase
MSGQPQHGAGNRGVQINGPGPVIIGGSVIGTQTNIRKVPSPQTSTRGPGGRQSSRWDIGVITVLSEETKAVTTMLAAAGSCTQRTCDSGLRFREARIETAGKYVTVAATQTLDRGQRAAVIAFEQLRQHYAPAVVVLVGIAGGISAAVRLGDVVVVQEVIYYDIRKETAGEVVRRGQGRPVPAAIRHAINAFFSDHGEPYRASIKDPAGTSRTCHVLPGPIGSGEAVVADKDSAIRQYLAAFNDKTLALETEAGGIAEAFYAMAGTGIPGGGWLAIRGISDHADTGKDDAYHEIASRHAAAILHQMLPYLKAGNATAT